MPSTLITLKDIKSNNQRRKMTDQLGSLDTLNNNEYLPLYSINTQKLSQSLDSNRNSMYSQNKSLYNSSNKQKYQPQVKKENKVIQSHNNSNIVIESPQLEKTNELMIQKNHPSFMTEESTNFLLNAKKSLVLGSVNCGWCKRQNEVLNGKFRTPIYNENEKRLDYEFLDYTESQQLSEKSLFFVKDLYKNKKIEKKKYDEIIHEIEKLQQINTVLNDPNIEYDKILKSYDISYVDDLSENDIKPFKSELNSYKSIMKKFNKHTSKLEGKFKKKEITKEQFKQEMKQINHKSIEFRDKFIKSIKSKPNGEKLSKYLIISEISDVYGLTAFPTFINDKCTITPENKDKILELAEMGYTKGILNNCTTGGYHEGFDFISFDAKNRNNTKNLNKLIEIQKQKRDKIQTEQTKQSIQSDIEEIIKEL